MLSYLTCIMNLRMVQTITTVLFAKLAMLPDREDHTLQAAKKGVLAGKVTV